MPETGLGRIAFVEGLITQRKIEVIVIVTLVLVGPRGAEDLVVEVDKPMRFHLLGVGQSKVLLLLRPGIKAQQGIGKTGLVVKGGIQHSGIGPHCFGHQTDGHIGLSRLPQTTRWAADIAGQGFCR